MGDVAVVIPARDEAVRIAATVTAAAGIPGVDLVVVVDDGSRDATAELAAAAGARVLRRTAREIGAPRLEVAEKLEEAALAELKARKPDRVLATNVEFWSAVVLDFAEVPSHMFTSMFTCARVAGWSAHVLEQKKLQRLVRPAALYVGPAPRKPSDVEGWDQISH